MIKIPKTKVEEFCQQNHIKKLAFFGSVLRRDFQSESDIDILVEFEPKHTPGLLRLAGMERHLSSIFDGRKVDLRTPRI